MTTEGLVLIRAVHFGACLLFFGFFAFDRFVAVAISQKGGTEISSYCLSQVRFFNLLLLPVVLLSGMAWFALVAMTMSGEPLGWEVLQTVWTQTEFGTVCKIRLVLWLAGVVATAMFFFFKASSAFQKGWVWLQLVAGALLLGSLAWAGHGLESSPWHLFADVLHLLVAGFWPAGLLPFALLLRKLRQTSGATDWISLAALVRRFSVMSLGSVALLGLTGLVNGWYLVGSFSNLFQQTYGRWLLAKIIFFGIAVAIGAVNLLRLKPRLLAENAPLQTAEATATQLQFNVRLELVLAMIIVVVVAILGILPPAIR